MASHWAGWLKKEKPGIMKGGWDKRWFVLDDDKLTYGKSEDDDQPKQLLIRSLGWCEAENRGSMSASASGTGGSATFLLTMSDASSREPYKLKAKNPNEADEWMEHIRAAIERHQLKEEELQDPRLGVGRASKSAAAAGGMSMREMGDAVETPGSGEKNRMRRSSVDLGLRKTTRRGSLAGFTESDGDGWPPKCWAHRERDSKGGLSADFKKVWVELDGSTLNTTAAGKKGEVADLVGCVVTTPKGKRKGYDFVLRVDLSAADSAGISKYVLAVPSDEARKQWMIEFGHAAIAHRDAVDSMTRGDVFKSITSLGLLDEGDVNIAQVFKTHKVTGEALALMDEDGLVAICI